MSGYREHSFDPNTGAEALPNPLTWVQRIGIACLFVGAAVIFAFLGGRFGLIPKWIDSPIIGTLIVVAAGPLIGAGARRAPLTPDMKRRRLTIMMLALAVAIIAAAVAFVIAKGA